MPGATSLTIKSQTQSTTYNGSNWRGSLNSLDVAQMYEIKTPAACSITLTGNPVNPAEHPVTILANRNVWLGFLLNESMSPNDAFGNFPVKDDVIQSRTSSATFTGSTWRGQLKNLEPGQGYIYKSASSENRTFSFGTNNK